MGICGSSVRDNVENGTPSNKKEKKKSKDKKKVKEIKSKITSEKFKTRIEGAKGGEKDEKESKPKEKYKDKYFTEIVGDEYKNIQFFDIDESGKVKESSKKLSNIIEDGTSKAWCVLFIATWCRWCPPSINDMKKNLEGRDDLELIALCIDEDKNAMEDFLGKHLKFLFDKFRYVGYCDKDFEKYKVKSVPHFVMLNKEKKIIRNYVVEVSEENPDDYDIKKIFDEATAIGMDRKNSEKEDEEVEGENEEDEKDVR